MLFYQRTDADRASCTTVLHSTSASENTSEHFSVHPLDEVVHIPCVVVRQVRFVDQNPDFVDRVGTDLNLYTHSLSERISASVKTFFSRSSARHAYSKLMVNWKSSVSLFIVPEASRS